MVVVPDVLANAGGVTVSYFEWAQNLWGFRWPLEDVHSRLQEIMTSAFNEIGNFAEERNVSARNTAAIKRIGEAVEVQVTGD